VIAYAAVVRIHLQEFFLLFNIFFFFFLLYKYSESKYLFKEISFI
jgi:hypothetical protein